MRDSRLLSLRRSGIEQVHEMEVVRDALSPAEKKAHAPLHQLSTHAKNETTAWNLPIPSTRILE